jgi:sugar/nucleoside kinase (ribokinase family)
VTCEGAERFEVPGVTVEAVDTTGAGDSFAGGVLAGLTRGLSLNQAAALGTYAGARVVSAYGPRLAESLDDQIDRILSDASPAVDASPSADASPSVGSAVE